MAGDNGLPWQEEEVCMDETVHHVLEAVRVLQCRLGQAVGHGPPVEASAAGVRSGSSNDVVEDSAATARTLKQTPHVRVGRVH